ncbi:glycoside hydrolase family 5 protein [Parabacteroides sp. AM08-6]|uniref:glycoside hydrolase family 5 protein n=1 Tax=Parabacteroides sp. AM08-6 TaxID=2292053 RepID=UPI000EFE7BAE|nr:cellulase family glycosylhydrolase [Parabacteroides sp. AM08-6]RHJ83197.1 glycosyl hydrolase family 5 [Parabacteroides sp. AM08-6]
MVNVDRRSFLKTIGLGTAMLGVSDHVLANSLSASIMETEKVKNKLPRWRGFNLLDFFSPSHYRKPDKPSPNVTTEDDFKWMVDWGFDFVRIPIAYPSYLNFNPKGDNSLRIKPDEIFDYNEEALSAVEELVYKANKQGLHVSLNLHRAPGYCINAGFHEPYNLWTDAEAQQAFYTHWEMWSKRFRHVSADKLSFDLVNEPNFREDMNDQFSKSGPVDGLVYKKVAEGCLEAIHKYNPKRLVVADGNSGGNQPVPELAGVNISQSCRGYFPHYISHYRASWVWKNPDDSPAVVWPGVIDGQTFNRKVLEDFYQPWFELMAKGVGVHCGECGCFRETPHDVFIAWFSDVLSILTEHNIGYALWNFRGDFGILDSGRKDVDYVDWHGHKLDKKMLDMLQKY